MKERRGLTASHSASGVRLIGTLSSEGNSALPGEEAAPELGLSSKY